MKREEEQSAAAKAKQETEEREEATREVRRGQARPERAVGANAGCDNLRARRWWNGIHDGLKIHCPRGLAGSNPARRMIGPAAQAEDAATAPRRPPSSTPPCASSA
jgi:hypothetical protein